MVKILAESTGLIQTFIFMDFTKPMSYSLMTYQIYCLQVQITGGTA